MCRHWNGVIVMRLLLLLIMVMVMFGTDIRIGIHFFRHGVDSYLSISTWLNRYGMILHGMMETIISNLLKSWRDDDGLEVGCYYAVGGVNDGLEVGCGVNYCFMECGWSFDRRFVSPFLFYKNGLSS